MSFRNQAMIGLFATACLLGWLTRPLVSDLQAKNREADQSTNLASIAPALGQGISVAVLGGYRSMAANMMWLSMYGNWERWERDEVINKMNLAVALNPHSLFFWVDGARILANDMPVWEVGNAQMDSLNQTAVGIAIKRRYANLALSFLADAPSEIAESDPILIEKGVIYWQKLEDLEAATETFALAIDEEGEPYYLSRVYAELLVKMGRLEEARDYLLKHLALLPDGSPRAMKPFVQNRIAQLNQQLQP